MEEHVREMNRLMEEGYQHGLRGDAIEASRAWLQCWEMIKAHLPTRPFDLAEEKTAFRGLGESLFNWLPEVEGEVQNASMEDPAFAEQHVRFCDEALELMAMPEHRPNFLRSRAQGLWRMGRVNEAESALQALLDEDPDDVWTHVARGDLYALERPVDLDRAEATYRQALERPTLREPEVIQERLEMLAELRGEKRPRRSKAASPAPAPSKQAHGDACGCGHDHAPVVQAVSQRIGRNEPCPCGSGKKYKKCCGQS